MARSNPRPPMVGPLAGKVGSSGAFMGRNQGSTTASAGMALDCFAGPKGESAGDNPWIQEAVPGPGSESPR